METNLSPDAPPPLTTEAVIAGCRAAGADVSKPQLSRWARAGLLSHPEPEGRGKGKGWSWLWPADTLPRAVIIARALQPQTSRDATGGRGRSLDTAADALMFKGYAPRTDILRQRLVAYLDLMQRIFTLRQTYLSDSTLSDKDKGDKYTNVFDARMAALGIQDAAERRIFAVLSAVSLGFSVLGQLISFDAQRIALDASRDEILEQAYAFAFAVTVSFPPAFDEFANAFMQSVHAPESARRKHPAPSLEFVETWREYMRPMTTLFLLSFRLHAADLKDYITRLGPSVASWSTTLGTSELIPDDTTIARFLPVVDWLYADSSVDMPHVDTGSTQDMQGRSTPS
jgi:hypothetical protein